MSLDPIVRFSVPNLGSLILGSPTIYNAQDWPPSVSIIKDAVMELADHDVSYMQERRTTFMHETAKKLRDFLRLVGRPISDWPGQEPQRDNFQDSVDGEIPGRHDEVTDSGHECVFATVGGRYPCPSGDPQVVCHYTFATKAAADACFSRPHAVFTFAATAVARRCEFDCQVGMGLDACLLRHYIHRSQAHPMLTEGLNDVRTQTTQIPCSFNTQALRDRHHLHCRYVAVNLSSWTLHNTVEGHQDWMRQHAADFEGDGLSLRCDEHNLIFPTAVAWLVHMRTHRTSLLSLIKAAQPTVPFCGDRDLTIHNLAPIAFIRLATEVAQATFEQCVLRSDIYWKDFCKWITNMDIAPLTMPLLRMNGVRTIYFPASVADVDANVTLADGVVTDALMDTYEDGSRHERRLALTATAAAIDAIRGPYRGNIVFSHGLDGFTCNWPLLVAFCRVMPDFNIIYTLKLKPLFMAKISDLYKGHMFKGRSVLIVRSSHVAREARRLEGLRDIMNILQTHKNTRVEGVGRHRD